MTRKKIVILLGNMPKKVSDGHSLNTYLLLKNIVEEFDCYIFGHFVETSFLHNIEELKGKIFKISKNSRLKSTLSALLTFQPFATVEFFNQKNIIQINKFISDNNIDILHSIYFPSTALLASKLRVSNKIMTVPDLYSKYYKLLFIENKKNVKFLYNFLSYLFLEFRLQKAFDSVQFVNYKEVDESGFRNAECVPLLISNHTENPVLNEERNIVLSRANRSNTLWFLNNIAPKLDSYNIKILSNDAEVTTTFERNKQKYSHISIVNWVDDYDQFVSSFYLQIVIDRVGTGLSNKIVDAFKKGYLIIGTELSYRGLKEIPVEIKNVFDEDFELINVINETMNLSQKEHQNRIEIAKKYIDSVLNNDEIIEVIKKSYSVQP